MKKLFDYESELSKFIEKNHPYFGKAVNIPLIELEKQKYISSNGKAYLLNDLRNYTQETHPTEDGLIHVTEDEIILETCLKDNTELFIRKNYEGRKSVYLQKRILLDDEFLINGEKPTGTSYWDGDEFIYLKNEAKQITDLLDTYKVKLPYEATFDFENKEIRVIKRIDEDVNLEKEVEDFDISKYFDFLEKIQ